MLRSPLPARRPPLGAGIVTALGLIAAETLLLFPRRLAPAYYDGIVAACQEAGFAPEIRAFGEPPVNAMMARLSSGNEVGLAPASFADLHPDLHEPGLVWGAAKAHVVLARRRREGLR